MRFTQLKKKVISNFNSNRTLGFRNILTGMNSGRAANEAE